MSEHFELMVTDIHGANTRSVRAHEKAGLETLHRFLASDGHEWVIVVMDLRADRVR
jgi:hypothetical protein